MYSNTTEPSPSQSQSTSNSTSDPRQRSVNNTPPPHRIGDRQQSAIRLSRLPSHENNNGKNGGKQPNGGRRRSLLEIGEDAARGGITLMPSVPEISQSQSQPQPAETIAERRRPGHFRRGTTAMSRRSDSRQEEYDSDIIDILDVLDPEVSTLSSITNVQNSLFVPSMGKWANRRPTYTISRTPAVPGAFPSSALPTATREESLRADENYTVEWTDYFSSPSSAPQRPAVDRIPSTVTDRFYAVRPHDVSLQGWSDEEVAQLDDHVRHMLHSRCSKFRRKMKAFGQYVKRPLGFFVTLYAVLITLFGLAWVLFLIGWVYVGTKQFYVINVIDNVLVALFAIVGDGLIPWRIVDTYHMIYIARYHHLTWKLRNREALPDLKNKNDLPSEPADLEAARSLHAKQELSVLNPKQQAKLEHHQACFSKSHTFYKPHETDTHFAFPLRLVVAIVVLLDCHSCFQLALGLCTWCIDYHVRPPALTAVILSCSIAVNTTAGILITIGDRRTRKKDVLQCMFRQELTEEAMRRIDQEKERKAKEAKEAEKRLGP
ncbi:uncharacterized protein BCR38DRAFT_430985 [Pseudomassariella vexata]|uniref:Integral membrane protein n=1 Tax=Pseudomassariella vexata TaxID=1141098 RepID=A0A1Y2DZT0_9PEZI|nr:uncharacterized protein BCR38DRAFT_430985 [Pseudomassariella vexata]ORY64781.1 hypothetical protein BCR38DRAFT_430985 [Pseudomassariella vexata]